MQFISLIDALTDSLRQEKDLIRNLPDGGYQMPRQGPYSSSIGQHIRHNLDHFAAFLSALELGKIDYERRERSTTISDQPEAALLMIQGYLNDLEDLKTASERPLQVREESDVGAAEPAWLPSSLGRELQFLLGHTVHHHALIAMIASGHGVTLPEGFGVAPSTLRHEKKAAQPTG